LECLLLNLEQESFDGCQTSQVQEKQIEHHKQEISVKNRNLTL